MRRIVLMNHCAEQRTSTNQSRYSSSFGRAISTTIAVFVIIVMLAACLSYVALTDKTLTSTNATVTSSTSSSDSNFASTYSSVSTSSITKTGANPLLLYSADAYVNESASLEDAFMSKTVIPITTANTGGSSAPAALISHGNPVSIFLSVSKTAVQSSSLSQTFPGWAVAIATDQMSLAYSSATTQNTAGAKVIESYSAAISANTTTAWYNFFNNLTSGQVRVGISDPNADPAGFRNWMVLEAAGFVCPNSQNYFVNRMLTNQANVTAASAAALLPAWRLGQIQFLFIYRSAIKSAGLNLIQLSNGINLGSPSYDKFYS